MTFARLFVAGPSEIQLVEVSDAASEAYDVRAADQVFPERAWSLALAAERDGQDPVAFARHFVDLRQGLRKEDGKR